MLTSLGQPTVKLRRYGWSTSKEPTIRLRRYGWTHQRKEVYEKKEKKEKKKVEKIQLDNLANLGSLSSKNEQAFLPIGLLLQVLCLYSNPKQYQEYSILDWLIPFHVRTEVSVI